MTTNTIFRDAESGGLNAFVDRPNADTAPDFHLSADMVTAIVQHELGKLGLWLAKEQRALAAYLATLPPAEPKPGETWELNPGDESFTAQVVEAPDGTICFVWCPFDEVAIRREIARAEGTTP